MDKIALFHNLVQMAAVDGKFTDEEIRFLVLRAESWGIPSEEFDLAMAGLSLSSATAPVTTSVSNSVSALPGGAIDGWHFHGMKYRPLTVPPDRGLASRPNFGITESRTSPMPMRFPASIRIGSMRRKNSRFSSSSAQLS